MRLGLLADIHGDGIGFQRALDWFASQATDHILCAGDVVDRGPDADAIVQELIKRSIPCIKGNHEFTLLREHSRWSQSSQRERLASRGRIVTQATLEYVAALPTSLRLPVENQHLVLAHGAPWSDVVDMLPEARSSKWQRLLNEHPHDQLIVLGHTHRPMHVRCGHLNVLNPGSVYGVTIRDSHTCAIYDTHSASMTLYDLKTQQTRICPVVELALA